MPSPSARHPQNVYEKEGLARDRPSEHRTQTPDRHDEALDRRGGGLRPSRYHLRRRECEIGNLDAVHDILRRGRFATLALCADNEPYAVTLSYGYDAERQALWFHTAPEGLKLAFLHRNPRVCGTVIEDRGYNDGDCTHSYYSAVFWGLMGAVETEGEKRYGLEVILRHQESDSDAARARFLADGVGDGLAVLRLDIEGLRGKVGN